VQLALPVDPDEVRPATRPELMPVALMAVVASFIALAISATHGYMLLYGDAVSHLGTARAMVDTDHPGLGMLGGVWLPLPHLLMTPFVGRMEWWQNGMAGAWPSMICFIVGAMGMYRLARRMVPAGWAFVATAFFGLNANLLYLSGTAMTEPLFLALMVWIVVVLLELQAALDALQVKAANRGLIALGLLILAAVATRYDGWILGAVVWCLVAWQVLRNAQLRAKVMPGFIALTVLSLAGPILWFWWNAHFAGDWLDFMRGPSSAEAIDRRTSPPGSHHHFGWHNPLYALVLYARTAQVDAAFWETGWVLAAVSLYAAWRVAAGKLWVFGKYAVTVPKALLLLWLPVPFYVYSIAYGSVPIFIPQLYPHSFYNSRYGMEMLPGLAIFGVLGVLALLSLVGKVNPKRAELAMRIAQPVALLLVVLNLVGMTYRVPLVLQEAIVNSRGRLALEVPMAEQLQTIEPGLPVLIENSEYVGALQMAGIPLRQTIGPGDYYRWKAALEDPAKAAAYVYAVDGDPIRAAVLAHPAGLTSLAVICTTGKPCLRIYRSDVYAGTVKH
jgi:hypothetical protein